MPCGISRYFFLVVVFLAAVFLAAGFLAFLAAMALLPPFVCITVRRVNFTVNHFLQNSLDFSANCFCARGDFPRKIRATFFERHSWLV